jgi:oxygen-independent coproporphyrinogen-3 oxidase
MTGIYIHFPFCVKKCFYCDFYSLEKLDGIDGFIDNLSKEIELRIAQYNRNLEVDSIFFGGGTPSLMKPKHLEKTLNSLNTFLTLAPDCEISLECNPGTIDIEYLAEYKKLGINRLSFGVQSFRDSELKFLERIHSSDEATIAISTAMDLGFDNVSLDLIFALPDQTLSDWDYSLNKAIELNPNHISAYSLIYEKGTPLYRQWKKGQIAKLEEDKDAELYLHTINKLTANGYSQYEVSNYAKNNMICRHNMKYWYGDDYIAFGPSAHGKLGKMRYWNYSSLGKYNRLLSGGDLPTAGHEETGQAEELFEVLFLQLRASGIKLDLFGNRFGLELQKHLLVAFENKIPNGYYQIEQSVLKLTSKGYCYADEISAEIMNRLEKLI